VLTAEGRGAIAVVRVWGPGALEAADRVFRPNAGPTLARTRPGRLRVGRVGAGPGDEVVAVHVGDPPEVEIQGHGGALATRLVLDALAGAGVVVVPAGQWLAHAASNRIEAEALADLARAPTLRTAEILLEQAQGALGGELTRLAAEIRSGDGSAAVGVRRLLARGRVGLRLVAGWRVALAGRPNVGKSCLLNALAGYERAIVAPTPGTTRDLVGFRTAFGGWPAEVTDTAGLRPSADPIEAAGVALAVEHQRSADLVLLVLDRSEPLEVGDEALLATYPEALVVANKADRPAAWSEAGPGWLGVSALRGDGIDALIGGIERRLVPEPPEPGAGVPFRAVQVRALERAARLLDRGQPDRAARLLERLAGARVKA
jgi:tRNA modification GTPase